MTEVTSLSPRVIKRRQGMPVYGNKCPFCGKYIGAADDTSDGRVQSTSSGSRKGIAKTRIVYHTQCYDAEMAKRREARQKRLKAEEGGS